MLRLAIISGLAASFWALILFRKNGPWNMFYWIRYYAEDIPGLRKVMGIEEGCETCCSFWLTIIGFLLGWFLPILLPLIYVSAGAAVGLWMQPTISIQVGNHQKKLGE